MGRPSSLSPPLAAASLTHLAHPRPTDNSRSSASSARSTTGCTARGSTTASTRSGRLSGCTSRSRRAPPASEPGSARRGNTLYRMCARVRPARGSPLLDDDQASQGLLCSAPQCIAAGGAGVMVEVLTPERLAAARGGLRRIWAAGSPPERPKTRRAARPTTASLPPHPRARPPRRPTGPPLPHPPRCQSASGPPPTCPSSRCPPCRPRRRPPPLRARAARRLARPCFRRTSR